MEVSTCTDLMQEWKRRPWPAVETGYGCGGEQGQGWRLGTGAEIGGGDGDGAGDEAGDEDIQGK